MHVEVAFLLNESSFKDPFIIIIIMSKENFQLCPFCKKGEMRTHRRGTDAEATPPFRVMADTSELKCDMCGHVIHDTKQFDYINVVDSVGAEVKRANAQETNSAD